MKLLYKLIDHPFSDKVSARRDTVPCFDSQWHFHKEMELICHIRGRGIRYLGDNVSAFSDGELALVGPNLPHLWRHDPEYAPGGQVYCTDMIIAQFSEDFLGSEFLNINEASRIKNIFKLAGHGILFTGKTRLRALKHICNLPIRTGMDRVIELLTILNILCQSDEFQLISGTFSKSEFQETEYQRITRVERYLLEHYMDPVSLNQVAELSHMSPNAFCRYFKKHTKRTLLEYVVELRIRHAARLIIQSEKRISEILRECGFKCETLFNRQFRKIMKVSPREYRYFHRAKELHCLEPL